MNERSEKKDRMADVHYALQDVPEAERQELAAIWHRVSVFDSAPYTPDPARLKQIDAALLTIHPPRNRHDGPRF